jgi:squalene-associated FAD-dependent desaturase
MKTAIVVGGGWAGCAAALELSRRGWKVTLVERGKALGGRAGSSLHPKLGLELDCGQHLFLGAYTQSLGLLHLLGARNAIHLAPRLQVDYFTSKGVVKFRAWPLPGPLALAGGLLAFPLLNASEKREVLLFGLRAWRGIVSPKSVRRISVATWLKRCGQSPGLIRKFWEPLCLAVVNASSDRAQAEMLAVALKRGFLKGGKTSALGVPLKPLSQLLQPALIERLAKSGSEARFGHGSKNIEIAKNSVSITLENGEVLSADACVLALPAHLAAKQCELNIREAANIEGSPILTAHVFSEGPILPTPFGTFAPEDGDPGFEFQWGFDRTVLCNEKGKSGEHWTCFLASAAKRLAGMPQDAILLELKRQLARRFPGFDPNSILQAVVLKEAKATPLFEPGASRPSQKTRYKNFALAGDWTDTGLPATIEGAVVSGILAADILS